MSPHELLGSLKPVNTQRIYDVLVAAGHDVSEWHLDADGNVVGDFTRNPRFRADWVFTDPTGRRLVSMWHDMIRVESGELVVRHNARDAKMQYQRMGENYRNYQGEQRKKELSKKSRGEQWARKAGTLDKAVFESYQAGTPLSVAIVYRETSHDQETESAKGRALDDSQWYVRSYEEDGEYVLVRGLPPEGLSPRILIWGDDSTPADNAHAGISAATSVSHLQAQGAAAVDAEQAAKLAPQYPPITTESYGIHIDDQFIDAPAEQKELTSTSYVRDPECRRAVLLRSNGVCEYCGLPGFIKHNGNTYLETHHIVPLAENGHDHPSNMIALCPNDHREAHYGRNKSILRGRFLAAVQSLTRN